MTWKWCIYISYFILFHCPFYFYYYIHVTVAKPSIHGNDEIETKSTFIHNFSSRNVKFESLIIDDIRKEIRF